MSIGGVKEKYREYLNTQEGTAHYNRFKEILYGTPDSLVVRLAESLYKRLKGKTHIRILDVGGGDGKRIRQLVNLLAEKGVRAEAVVVEPSEEFVGQLRRSLSGESEPRQISAVRSLYETFDTEQRFDMVLFVHSIFTFLDTQYIKNTQKFLKEDGIVCVASNDSNSFLANLKKVLDASHHSKRKEIDSVTRDLTEAGFVLDTEHSITRFDDCLENGELNDSGKSILEWLALRDMRDIPPSLCAVAKKIFNEYSEDGSITERELFVFGRQHSQ